jgi:hypothetical protein
LSSVTIPDEGFKPTAIGSRYSDGYSRAHEQNRMRRDLRESIQGLNR